MKLLQKIENRLLKRTIIGVGYSETHGVSAILVKVVNSNLQVVESISGSEELQKFLARQKDIPVSLTLDTNSVLFTSSDEPISGSNLGGIFLDFVPGGAESQFLIEYERNCLGIARITALNTLEKELNLKQLVVNICLMPVSAIYLANFLKGRETSVHLQRFHFTFNEPQVSIEPGGLNDQILDVEGERIEPIQVLPLVAILNYLNPTAQKKGAQGWEDNYKEFFYRKVFMMLRMPILACFLIVFLVNSFLFISWDAQLQTLREQSVFANQVLDQIAKAESYLSEREVLKDELSGQRKYSIICDQIGVLIPESITLNSLSINPLSKARLSDKMYEQDIVMIEGQTSDPLQFIELMEVLKEQGWVAEVVDQKFENASGSAGQFTLKIRIRNEWFEL